MALKTPQKKVSKTARISEADRLKRVEERLTFEAEQLQGAIDRLEGIRDWRVIGTRNGLILIQSKIREYLFMISGEKDQIGAR